MSAAWDWGPAEVAAHVAAALPEAGAVGEPERLSGGLLNVVWRVPVGSQSVIAKVTPPFVATLPDVPLDPARQRVEAAALRAFGFDGPLAGLASAFVRPPRLLHHDPERAVLLMEDVGDLPDLGAALAHSDVDARAIGERLGRFVGALHAAPVTDALRTAFHNPGAQATRLEVQYRSVGPALAEAGVPDAAALGAEAVSLGERFLEPGRCLIQGDLWPPSVLVRPDGALRVIDWELAHVGAPAQDLGHLGAHLWMLGHRGPEAAARAVWEGILVGYAAGTADALPGLLREGTLADATRHVGCEVLVRAVGPFREGSAYDGLTPGSGAVAEAVRFAATSLRAPSTASLFGTLG